MAERLPLPDDPDDPLWPHLLIEAAGAAGHDRVDALREDADVDALLHSPELRKEIAEHNFQLGREHFSFEVIEDRLGELFSF